jgi:hypothetical protein
MCVGHVCDFGLGSSSEIKVKILGQIWIDQNQKVFFLQKINNYASIRDAT